MWRRWVNVLTNEINQINRVNCFSWKVNDVGQSREQKVVSHFLTHLIPYTQYAFYVKTYTIANEQHGAQSPIQYFRTLPAGKLSIIPTREMNYLNFLNIILLIVKNSNHILSKHK